ncbi:hypothetical protein CFP56_024911 [Quercus suber]|uniref:Uncharacterized protein n=1 Tax=Quercus suber TaxID=58331 RepID=A0AAW0K4K8_QUESU
MTRDEAMTHGEDEQNTGQTAWSVYDQLIGALPQPKVSRGSWLPRSMVRSKLSSARSLQLPCLSSSSSSPRFPTLRSSLLIHSHYFREFAVNEYF